MEKEKFNEKFNDVPQIAKILDLPLIQEFQDQFAQNMGVALRISDLHGNSLTKTSNLSDFCRLIRLATKREKECYFSDKRVIQKVVEERKPSFYFCRAGLAHVASPIFLKGIIVGVVLAGGIGVKSLEVKKVNQLAKDLKIDEEKLMEGARKIKILSRRKLYSATNLLSLAAEILLRLALQAADAKRKVKGLSVLSELSKAISSTLSIESLSNLALKYVNQLFEVYSSSLMLLDEEEKDLKIIAAQGLSEEVIKKTRVKLGEGISGKVSKEGKPLILRGRAKDSLFGKERREVKEAVCVPLKVKNKMLGVLNISDKISGESFTSHDVKLLTLIGSEVAVAIENVKLHEGLEKKVTELSGLLQLSKYIASSLELEEVLKAVVEGATHLMNAQFSTLWLFDENTDEFHLNAFYGLDPKLAQEVPKFKLEPEPLKYLLSQKSPVVIPCSSGFKPAHSKFYREKGIDKLVIAPLVVKDKLIGALSIHTPYYRYSQDELNLLASLANQAGILVENAKLYEDLKEYYLKTVQALIAAVEAKDPYTKGHSLRVADLAVKIAEELSLTKSQISKIQIAALLHDVGKIGISEQILLKPDKLSKEEYEIIKNHTIASLKIIEPVGFSQEIVRAVRHHHEDVNSLGYPNGLKDEEIPIEAKIIRVADAFDAMVSERPYRPAFSLKETIKELKANVGKQFDRQIVDAFLKVLKKEVNPKRFFS